MDKLKSVKVSLKESEPKARQAKKAAAWILTILGAVAVLGSIAMFVIIIGFLTIIPSILLLTFGILMQKRARYDPVLVKCPYCDDAKNIPVNPGDVLKCSACRQMYKIDAKVKS